MRLQVDRKFVIIECNGTLVAVDQHAADERVRLEGLRDRLLAAVNAGAGRQSPANTRGQRTAGHEHRRQRPDEKAGGRYDYCAVIAAGADSTADGVPVGDAAGPLRLPSTEAADLLASHATGILPAGNLSDSERHLYEAYRDQVERCLCNLCAGAKL